MEGHEHNHHHVREKLKLFKSPIAGHTIVSKHASHDEAPSLDPGREAEKIPKFKRYAEPTLLEIFYDLFFAANYSVFSENREVTNHNNFKAYIGYFCLLWITWFLTTSYDVRFVTDSVFERTARAVSLGVLVGFAVVAPNFDPSEQSAQVMRTMSLILMFSRAILAVEYASTLFHARSYKKSRKPLYISILINLIAMLVYMGITFRFKENKNSRVYMIWYFISGAEGIATLIVSYMWPVMDFSKTHLIKRLTLLTIMMLGDSLINIAKEVVTIVKTPDAWDSRTIGLITAGVATVYFVFLIYFDWLRSSFYLPPVRQLIWTALHLPFHLSLVLFMQAFTHYIIWGKVMGILNRIHSDLIFVGGRDSSADFTNKTTSEVVKEIKEFVDDYFGQYPAELPQTLDTVNTALKNISSAPDSLWPQIIALDKTGKSSAISEENFDELASVVYSVRNIILSLTNNIFQAFGIDVAKDAAESEEHTQGDIHSGLLQSKVDAKTWRRYRLVFAYGYIAAGCCLLFMAALSIVSRTTRWKPWPVIRLVILLILAIGTGLVSLLWFSGPNPERAQDDIKTDICLQYLETPWVLITIFVLYTIVLVLTHIGRLGPKDPNGLSSNFLSRKKRRRSYESVSVPMTSSSTWHTKGQVKQTSTHEQHRPSFDTQGRDDVAIVYGVPDRSRECYDPLKQHSEYKGMSCV